MIREVFMFAKFNLTRKLNICNLQNGTQFVNLLKYSTNAANITLQFNSNFTQDEEKRILNALNESTNDQLLSYSISKNKITSIQRWKSKMGPFNSLNEILEVDGFSEKLLDKICKRIIFNNENNTSDFIPKLKEKIKRPKQLIIPYHDNKFFQSLNSVTGIHLSGIGISWARISRIDNTLTHWNIYDSQDLPKKMTLIDTFQLAVILIKTIPPSEVYVFETLPSLSLNGQSKPLVVSLHHQQQDLIAILMALLNTSPEHNMFSSIEGLDDSLNNRVYFIKSKLPAKVFNLLVGNEKVSAVEITSKLLESKNQLDEKVPCTPITVDDDTKTTFLQHSSVNQEILGKALLIGITFMDLFVYNNFKCWCVVTSKNKRK